MTFDQSKLEKIPALPGVYLMKSANGTILYVGKANHLKQRVRNYFVAGGDGRPIIPLLIEKIAEIDTIVVTSEKEALLLENTLIKQHQPKYNALLKDDKTYVALKVNNKHPWPTIQLIRYKGSPEADGLYFGPYISAHDARITLDLIHRFFPLRQCSDQELIRRTRPCILYDMKRCIAPCVGKCTKEEYFRNVDRTIKFLRGQNKEILKELYAEMAVYAEQLQFEEADAILKLIRRIENTLEGQSVHKPLGGNADALSIYRQGADVIIAQLLIREGKLIGSRHYNFTNIAEEDTALISSFILQHYETSVDLPEEILIPFPLAEADLISEILAAKKVQKMKILMPQRGDKKSLVEMAFLNAEATFKREKDIHAIREKTLLEMQECLHLNQYPKRIECFDNSNISGTNPVAALVTFTEGIKDTKGYRKYKIKTVSSPDDYATMYEVLMRRYQQAKEENNLPDLVIIDGGKGHLNVALRVFAELNVITVDLIAVAKEQSRHDKGMTSEQVFLPNVRDPISLKRHSSILFLLQQIRDEAHRFAITFHRQRRSKMALKSDLEEIQGIGPIKKKLLLRHFGSVKRLKEASRKDIEKVKGLSKANVDAILAFINRNGDGQI